MAYIGNSPIIGNFQVCDAISVVNGQAAYTMQVDSANVTPESANHMLVSLNGILQKPGSSFTISGSTITFASNLATGDVIDFIMLLGNVLDIGTPSDATVTNAKTNFTSTSSAAGLQIKGDGTTDGTLQLNCSQNSHGIKLASPAHSAGQSYTLTFPATAPATDKFLKTDSSGNLSFADAGGGMFELISTTTVSSGVSSVDFTSLSSDFDDFRVSASQFNVETDGEIIRARAYVSGSLITSSKYQYLTRGYESTELTIRQNAGTEWRFGENVGNAGGECASFEFTIFGVHDTTHNKSFLSQFIGQDTSTEIMYVGGGGNLDLTSAITGLSFYNTVGNIISGKFSLYGRKR
jgi:hypothetical protein